MTEPLPGEPVWVLSAFPPGEYELRVSAPGNFATTRLRASVEKSDLELTALLRRQ